MHYLSTHISKCVNLFGEIRKAICPVEKYIEKNEFDFDLNGKNLEKKIFS